MNDYDLLVKIIASKEAERTKLEAEIALFKRLLELIRQNDSSRYNS